MEATFKMIKTEFVQGKIIINQEEGILYMMQNLYEHILNPIFVNVISPLVLFGLAYFLMKFNWISRKTSLIYTTVKKALVINNDTEIANSPTATTTKNQPKNNESNSIDRLSKNHGSDKGWKIRTFYTISKAQIFKYDSINFKIRNHDDLNIEIKTKWLIYEFELDSQNEEISDRADKIRIYIYQEKERNQDFYIVRFGRKALEKPIKLGEENSIIKQ